MVCNNESTCCGLGSSVISGCKCSRQYGYSDKSITFTDAGTFEIWNSNGIEGLSGTVIIDLTPIFFSAGLIINGEPAIEIFRFISISVNELNSVAILANVPGSICASVIVNSTNCC